MQHIGEGQLDIPGTWHNQSVNIYTAQSPGMPGLSLTVNRDHLPFATSLATYTRNQLDQLSKQLKGFELLGQADLKVDGREAGQFEFAWEADKTGPIHQLLLSIADGQTLLNLAATFNGRMDDAQLAEVRRIVQSFKFNPPTQSGQA